jgi:hypothetical protein
MTYNIKYKLKDFLFNLSSLHAEFYFNGNIVIYLHTSTILPTRCHRQIINQQNFTSPNNQSRILLQWQHRHLSAYHSSKALSPPNNQSDAPAHPKTLLPIFELCMERVVSKNS